MNIPTINNQPLELRFWHTEDQKMYNVFDVSYYDVQLYLEGNDGQWCASLEEGVLSQYTGITDKAGNRSWEGDIVLMETECEWGKRESVPVCWYSTVVFQYGMFGLTNAGGLEKLGSSFSFIIDPHKTPYNTTGQSLDVLVVGDIHQHSNLLRFGALCPVADSSHLTILTYENRHI